MNTLKIFNNNEYTTNGLKVFNGTDWVAAGMNVTQNIGEELNFEVVGGTVAPESPVENTIWVNTDVAISSWVFSANQPTSPVEGMVWLRASISSSAPINILKENSIYVYPDSCKQYLSGEWVNMDAMTYQNGEWLQWYIYLLKDGALTDLGLGLGTNVQGGWTGYGNGSITYTEGDCLCLNVAAGKNAIGSATRTTNTIDLTPYRELRVRVKDFSATGANPGSFALIVGGTSAYQGSGGTRAASIGTGFADMYIGQIISLDISNVTGSYYVILAASHFGNTTAQGGRVDIDQIYFY